MDVGAGWKDLGFMIIGTAGKSNVISDKTTIFLEKTTIFGNGLGDYPHFVPIVGKSGVIFKGVLLKQFQSISLNNSR